MGIYKVKEIEGKMNHKKILLLIFISFLITNVAIPGYAQFTYDYSKSLKGLTELRLYVGNLSEDAINVGITKERIKTITELKLRREGITIAEEGEALLFIAVYVRDKVMVGTLDIYDRIILYRDPSISHIVGIIWHSLRWGYEEPSISAEHFYSALSEQLDDFLNDWYKANPKK